MSLFSAFKTNGGYPFIGEPSDVEILHSIIIVSYMSSLCKNIAKRLGDAAGQVSIAATIFLPASMINMELKDQLEKIKFLAEYFNINAKEGANELMCFRSYMESIENKSPNKYFDTW